jgi:hypothetical protein
VPLFPALCELPEFPELPELPWVPLLPGFLFPGFVDCDWSQAPWVSPCFRWAGHAFGLILIVTCLFFFECVWWQMVNFPYCPPLGPYWYSDALGPPLAKATPPKTASGTSVAAVTAAAKAGRFPSMRSP